MNRSDYMSCPRECGVDVREHNSSGLVNGRCDIGPELPLLDVGGYLVCGCHGSQREHTCTSSD
ncbi:hypothetical protein QTQ03_12550 [Micromonospora sp. WMMA1363]|uniref:hypothetical protein n=1 Tax=Micromonospora sp. WMMA1363 TaxID=3053985 RepID=UPI00259CF4B5|nr:hypothetical protein [Micromonospora sp. WMMA1363]MDM4720363.1 hypothetical protein [Micromonospora sp. WMMA1363]